MDETAFHVTEGAKQSFAEEKHRLDLGSLVLRSLFGSASEAKKDRAGYTTNKRRGTKKAKRKMAQASKRQNRR